MLIRGLIIGFLLWLAATLLIRFFGEHGVPDSANAFTVVVLAAGALMVALVWGLAAALGVPGPQRLVFAVGLALPGLLLDAFVVSHFQIVFPNLDPELDKGFGALLLWAYGFILIGGLVSGRRA